MSYIEWGALGLFLVLLELFIPGVYLVWFGLASILVSTGMYLDWIPDLIEYQLVVFALASCITTGIGLWIYLKVQKHFSGEANYKNLNDLAAQYVGNTAVLLQDVVDGKSKVKIGDTVWLAVCDKPLKTGDAVVIVGVEKGLIFIVTKK